jgi:DNA polymerase I-like protein with 3'-5' exonuclease and polymerase domains
MHDEVILCIKKGNREKAEALLREAIRETNEELKLNVSLNIDIQFGGSYAAIH